jgi:hypothetical protein
VRLGHRVQRTSVLKPLDLGLVEGLVQLDLEGLAVLGVYFHRDGLANSQLGAEDVDLGKSELAAISASGLYTETNLVIGLDLVVVGRLSESKGKHTLLLQVGLVDTSE